MGFNCPNNINKYCNAFFNQVLLAMEDYAKAYKLNPKLTVAVFNRAKYYFGQENWTAAINDFSEFLRKESFDPHARLLRGRAYTALAQHQVSITHIPIYVYVYVLRFCPPKNAALCKWTQEWITSDTRAIVSTKCQ